MLTRSEPCASRSELSQARRLSRQMFAPRVDFSVVAVYTDVIRTFRAAITIGVHRLFSFERAAACSTRAAQAVRIRKV